MLSSCISFDDQHTNQLKMVVRLAFIKFSNGVRVSKEKGFKRVQEVDERTAQCMNAAHLISMVAALLICCKSTE